MEIEARTKRWGSSLGIVIPKDLVERENLKKNQLIKILAVETEKKPKLKDIFGALKNWKINTQKFKDEIRKEELDE
ncbi:MAG: AbrB/MazE/SpoVT family DNA-binding domain-containing protein [Nanoarchaeota archaeon]|nr:AbrB/MazE/SpoVT family DNA-binding domain-containing protein [Nanoarchaeota archaeon]